MSDQTKSNPADQGTHPLKRDIRSPGMWKYLVNYILIGTAAVLILMEIFESGSWRKLGIPVLFLALAIVNLSVIHASERKRANVG